MQVSEYIKKSTQSLQAVNVVTARLDTLVMLEHVTLSDRAQILAHPEMDIKSADYNKLTKFLNRRIKHEPLSYILGKSEFYGREFIITPAVLEPRPESETAIDMLKEICGERLANTIYISDVGTGSGSLGITAALEVPKAKVELLELDPSAIVVAKTNVDKFTLNIPINKSNLLANSSQQSDILLCNLPYVPDDYPINKAATHEPGIAIFGGVDGLDIYRELFKQTSLLSRRPLYILTESLPAQHLKLKVIALSCGYSLIQTVDFIQQFKSSAYSQALR